MDGSDSNFWRFSVQSQAIHEEALYHFGLSGCEASSVDLGFRGRLGFSL